LEVNLLENKTKTPEAKKMRSFTCPTCGWTVISPFGDDDIMQDVILHSKNHHGGGVNQSNAETVKKRIKDA
jgi:predicted small metal-binding protein